jgi:hypothetical protein
MLLFGSVQSKRMLAQLMRLDASFPPAISFQQLSPTSPQRQALSDAFERGFLAAGYQYVLGSHENYVQPSAELCLT